MYFPGPLTKEIHITSVYEWLVYFWREGLLGEDIFDRVDHNAWEEVPKNLAWGNVTISDPRLIPSEVVYKNEDSDLGDWPLLKWRTEQYEVACMKNLFENVSKPGPLVMDPFACTSDTEKSRLSLKKHRRKIGVDMDAECLDAALPGLLIVFVSHGIVEA